MAEKQGNKIEKECYKTVLAFSISTRGFNTISGSLRFLSVTQPWLNVS